MSVNALGDTKLKILVAQAWFVLTQMNVNYQKVHWIKMTQLE
jgi:hypothetical protein